MISSATPHAAPTCVWMNAGLLTYKLCDRDFDCEHCPLDAALRGAPAMTELRISASVRLERRTPPFPGDRLYSRGHTWLESADAASGKSRAVRFGVDSFAASLIAAPRLVRCVPPQRLLRPGETACRIELDFGTLAIGSPVAARVSACNLALGDDPAAMVAAPYGAGWLLELIPSEGNGIDGLLSSRDAEAQARLDWRRLCRRAALHLLIGEDDAGPRPPENGDGVPPTDLRRILGAARFQTLVRELIH